MSAAALPRSSVFDASRLRDPDTVRAIEALKPDLGLSIFFGFILKRDLLRIFPRGVVNLHPSFLPYNRGSHPNVWSIVDGTPAGVTMHFIDEGVDTGDVVAQKELKVEMTDTGESLYRKLERGSVALFRETWPLIQAGAITRLDQPTQGGTFHRVRDLEALDAIDLDRSYVAKDLIDILRARTFPPYRGAYVTLNGRRAFMRLSLEWEEDDQKEGGA